MRYFAVKEVREAVRWAAAGGQALHTHPFIIGKAPAPFVKAGERGELIAHLFDWDTSRLVQTARSFGVRRVFVHHAGTPRQHIDLCARPLRAAAACCESPDDGAKAWNVSQAKLWYVRQNYTPAVVSMGPYLSGSWPGASSSGRRNGFVWASNAIARSLLFNGVKAAELSYAVLPDELFEFVLVATANGNLEHRLYAPDSPSETVAIVYRRKIDAVQALKDSFTVMTPGDIHRYGAEWTESGVEARFAAMNPNLFTERFQSVFHTMPAKRDLRLAFGELEGSAA